MTVAINIKEIINDSITRKTQMTHIWSNILWLLDVMKDDNMELGNSHSFVFLIVFAIRYFAVKSTN